MTEEITGEITEPADEAEEAEEEDALPAWLTETSEEAETPEPALEVEAAVEPDEIDEIDEMDETLEFEMDAAVDEGSSLPAWLEAAEEGEDGEIPAWLADEESVTEAEIALVTAQEDAAVFEAIQDALNSGNIERAVDSIRTLLDATGLTTRPIEHTVHLITESLAQYPDEPALYEVLGDAQSKNGQLSKALEAYKLALAKT